MYINRALSLAIMTLLTNNIAHPMLLSSAQLRLKNAASQQARRICSIAQQQQRQTLKNRLCFVAGVATTGGVAYGYPYALKSCNPAEEALKLKNAAVDGCAGFIEQSATTLWKQMMNPQDPQQNPQQQRRHQQFTIVHVADALSCNKQIKEIVASGHNPFDYKTSTGKTLLVAASEYNDIESLKLLITHGATAESRASRINYEKEKMELTALHLQNPNSLKRFIQTLTEANLNPNDFVTRSGKTPLMAACELGDLELVQVIMEKGGGAFVNKKGYEETGNYDWHNAISCAVKSKNAQLVAYLCEYPDIAIDFDATDKLINPPYGFLGQPCEVQDGFVAQPFQIQDTTSAQGIYLTHRAKHQEEQNRKKLAAEQQRIEKAEELLGKRLNNFCQLPQPPKI